MAEGGGVIKRGSRVGLRYTMHDAAGKYLGGSGTEIESFVHGSGAVVRGLERALEGRSAGEKLEVTVKPEDGFGQKRRGPGPQPIPRATFPANAELKVGMKFQAESPDRKPIDLVIARIAQHEVFVDANHPFAGMTLRYEIEVVTVG